jgi:transcriptional regulator with XRE-family HTH domain
MSEYEALFGKHVRALRRARGLTQDALAKRSDLSADTIRRVEHGSFAMSITTLRKLCNGLGLSPSTIFESFELQRTDERRELFDLLGSRSKEEVALVARIVRTLLAELDSLAAARKKP